eukprot:363724-Chlamydomonas_euryale.AAC.4
MVGGVRACGVHAGMLLHDVRGHGGKGHGCRHNVHARVDINAGGQARCASMHIRKMSRLRDLVAACMAGEGTGAHALSSLRSQACVQLAYMLDTLL